MKHLINKYRVLLITGSLFTLVSCNDFLEMAPLDEVTPDVFFTTESDLASYAIKQYKFSSHDGFSLGRWVDDNHTDNQATASYDNRWAPGELRVQESIKRDDDPWNFDNIRKLNYFLEKVLPRWQAKEINGTEANIKQYIGEIYFLRAYQYLNKLQTFGDFPIVRTTLPDEMAALTEASYRRPRNEVARFVISDLDSALMLLNDNPPGGKNRITRNAALLLKSRAGLYEASWETYHKGTALVPGGSGWPGAAKDYLSGYSIDIENEIRYFLDESMKASAELADKIALETNNGDRKMNNRYYTQFVDQDLESYGEVLLWRAYSKEYNESHSTGYYLQHTGGNNGFTRLLVDGFLCDDGLPIYASPRYMGDDFISTVKANRDDRLQLFMKEPGELLSDAVLPEYCPFPQILIKPEERSVTGYYLRKGMPHVYEEGGQTSLEGCVIFRASEAYLNYIEASCIKNGGNSIDSKASGYWKALRSRAKLPEDYMVTVSATNLSKETDWAVYSAGVQVSPLLFNIRRERRCELIQEGFRMGDLKRWRALDKIKNTPIEGFKLWGPMKKWYDTPDGGSKLVPQGATTGTPNVSSPTNSLYLRPYQIVEGSSNKAYNGYNWCEAHYLTPIAMQHFRITAANPDEPTSSIIYQNPGWPYQANSGAIGF